MPPNNLAHSSAHILYLSVTCISSKTDCPVFVFQFPLHFKNEEKFEYLKFSYRLDSGLLSFGFVHHKHLQLIRTVKKNFLTFDKGFCSAIVIM